MKGKDLLLVAGGLALGYLLFKKDLFKKKASVGTNVSEAVSGAGQMVGGAVDTVVGAVETILPTGGTRTSAQDVCEKKWTEFASTARFASTEDMENQKAKFINSCLLG